MICNNTNNHLRRENVISEKNALQNYIKVHCCYKSTINSRQQTRKHLWCTYFYIGLHYVLKHLQASLINRLHSRLRVLFDVLLCEGEKK